MRIGVDGRSLEEQRTGIGRYLGNILREWTNMNPAHEFFLYYIFSEPQDHFLRKPLFQTRRVRFSSTSQEDIFAVELGENPVNVFFSPLYDLPLSLRSPAVITVHDMVYEQYPENFLPEQLAYLRSRTKYALERADRIITDSEFAKSDISRFYPGVEHKIDVIPLGIDPIFRPVEVDRERLKEEFGIKEHFIFYLGSITPKRHIPQLLESFRTLAADFPKWQLVLVGQNFSHPPIDLSGLIAGINGAIGRKAVVWRDYVNDEDLLQLYNGAEIFAYLSSYEGFGMPPLEAMACKTAVLTTALASLPEVTGDAVMTVDPLNLKEVRDSLRILIQDENRRKEFQEAGLKQAAMFIWPKTAQETLRVLEEAALAQRPTIRYVI